MFDTLTTFYCGNFSEYVKFSSKIVFYEEYDSVIKYGVAMLVFLQNFLEMGLNLNIIKKKIVNLFLSEDANVLGAFQYFGFW